MSNVGLKNKVLSLSPYIEIFVRNLYWKNSKLISKLVKKSNISKEEDKIQDFTKVLDYLNREGIGKGNLMVLHSSYEALDNTKLSPKQLIDELLMFIGDEGTLAMNSARKFKEENPNEYLTQKFENTIVNYDLKKSKVWTGALPLFFLRNKNVQISKFPINPMIAVGNLAKEMMVNNLNGDLKACGKGSSWEFCVDNNAVIVGLGIDLTHSLTIMHVAEDANPNWPIKDWYGKRKYNVIDESNESHLIEVLERNPKWGALHFAERTLCKDLISNNILKVFNIDGLDIEYLYAKDLINFLNSKNSKGYPYFNFKQNDFDDRIIKK